MATLAEIARTAPELVDHARAVLSSAPNAVLATYRADGSVRLSGVDPSFVAGELWIGSMPAARKGDDLKRRPDLALHSIPWDSRRVRDDHEHIAADVKLTGRALLATGDDRAAFVDWSVRERGFRVPDASDLFRIDVVLLSSVRLEDGQLVFDTWSEREPDRAVRTSRPG